MFPYKKPSQTISNPNENLNNSFFPKKKKNIQKKHKNPQNIKKKLNIFN